MTGYLLLVMALGATLGCGAQFVMPTGWWLNSLRGVISMCLVTAAASWLVSRVPKNRSAISAKNGAVSLWIGVNIGASSRLFWIGPGTIFPLVMAIAAVLTGLAVAIGWRLAIKGDSHGQDQ